MKAHAANRGPPPDVDEGDAPDLVALLRRELGPTPGRLGDCVRIVVVVLAVVAILETFRIPEIAVSAYIVLFLSGREAASCRDKPSTRRAEIAVSGMRYISEIVTTMSTTTTMRNASPSRLGRPGGVSTTSTMSASR